MTAGQRSKPAHRLAGEPPTPPGGARRLERRPSNLPQPALHSTSNAGLRTEKACCEGPFLVPRPPIHVGRTSQGHTCLQRHNETIAILSELKSVIMMLSGTGTVLPSPSVAVLPQVCRRLGKGRVEGGMGSAGNPTPQPPPTPVGWKPSGLAQSSAPASLPTTTHTLGQTGSASDAPNSPANMPRHSSTSVPCREPPSPSAINDTAKSQQHLTPQPQGCSRALLLLHLGKLRFRHLTLPRPPPTPPQKARPERLVQGFCTLQTLKPQQSKHLTLSSCHWPEGACGGRWGWRQSYQK